MRILALIPGGIDKQILFFPTLEDLQIEYPNSIIDVMVEPRAKAAYRVCPYVRDVLAFDYKDRNSLADYLNLMGTVRDREYDLAISLTPRWTLGLLLWLNGVPTRLGYQTDTSWFLSNRVPLKTEQYLPYIYHDLLQGLGINKSCPPLKISVPKDDITWAEAQQKSLNIKDTGYILIHNAPEQNGKNYPTSKWLEIVKDIRSKQPELPIVLIPSANDREWSDRLLQTDAKSLQLSPPDLGKLAAIIAGANLTVCTNSILMHLSVAVGTYTIALFGANEAKKLFPSNEERYIAIESSTATITDIKPETILQQIWRD
jgi:ADP-heptose:LPS heptosyltransferase